VGKGGEGEGALCKGSVDGRRRGEGTHMMKAGKIQWRMKTKIKERRIMT